VTIRAKFVFIVGFIFVVAVSLISQAAALPKTAELVPAETIVLVDIGDFKGLRAGFEKSFLYKLYKEPAMAAFVKDLRGKLDKKFQQDQDEIARTILDANGLPEGRVAVALVMNEKSTTEQEPAIVLISQWGGNVEGIKAAIEKMVARAIEQDAHRTIEDYRGVSIATLTTEVAPQRVADWESYKPEDGNVTYKMVQPPPEQIVYCFIDDCLIAGTDVETVQFVVAQIKGAGGSALAGDIDYASAMAAVGPDRDVGLYVNFKEMMRKIAAEDTTGRVRTTLTNMGLNGLSGLSCSLGFDTGGEGLFSGKAFLRTTGTRRGVLKMLETNSRPVKPPRFVPASSYSLSFVNVDIRQAYDELYGVVIGFNPIMAMAMQKPLIEADAEGGPAVSLRNDIIEYLGSEIVIAQSINKPFTMGVMPTENLMAFSVSNRIALEKSLSYVHRRLMVPNNPEPTRDLLGHTIYLLPPSGLPFLDGGAAMQSAASGTATVARMAFTITDTHLILGPEPAVERAIRTLAGTENESIGSAEWFARVKSAVPSVVGLAGFEDDTASAELLWWMLKESAKAQRASVGMGPAAAVMSNPDFGELADFGLLPDFDEVKRYFGYSAFYGISRADGFHFEFKYIDPRSISAN